MCSSLAFLVSIFAGPAGLDDKDARAIVDKAIKAMGGEEKLMKAGTHFTKAREQSPSTAMIMKSKRK